MATTIEPDQITKMIQQAGVAYKIWGPADTLLDDVSTGVWTRASNPDIYSPNGILQLHQTEFPSISQSGMDTRPDVNSVYDSLLTSYTNIKTQGSTLLNDIMRHSWTQPMELQNTDSITSIFNNLIYHMKQTSSTVQANTISYTDEVGPSGLASNKENLGPIMTSFSTVDPYAGDGTLIDNQLVRKTSEFIVRNTDSRTSGKQKFSVLFAETSQAGFINTIAINGTTATAASGKALKTSSSNLLNNSAFQIKSGGSDVILPDWLISTAASGYWKQRQREGSVRPMRLNSHLWVNPSGASNPPASDMVFEQEFGDIASPDSLYVCGASIIAPSGFSGANVELWVVGDSYAASGSYSSAVIPTSYNGILSHKYFFFGTPHNIPDSNTTDDILRFAIKVSNAIDGDIYIGNTWIHKVTRVGGAGFAYAPCAEDPTSGGSTETADEWRGQVTVTDGGVAQSFFRDALGDSIVNALPSSGSPSIADTVLTD